MGDGDAPAYKSACARCGRTKADGVTLLQFVPVFGLPGASTPPVCADTRDCERFRAEPVAVIWETSEEHGELQGALFTGQSTLFDGDGVAYAVDPFTMRRVVRTFWCHDCKRWGAAFEAGDGFECATCGAAILCDECGRPWVDGHGHELTDWLAEEVGIVGDGDAPAYIATPDGRRAMFGANSPDTAYVVDDYPYGFRLRTSIRYWIETTKHGDRFVSQTVNPKTGRWNKPKASTYVGVAVLTRDPSNGHIFYTGCTENNGAAWVGVFRAAFWDELSAAQQRQLLAIIGYTRAMEQVTFSIRKSTGWTPEQHAEADREQRIQQVQLGRLIAVETRNATIESVVSDGDAPAYRTPVVEVNRDRYNSAVWNITRGSEKLGRVRRYGRGWGCAAWVEGALHQWDEPGKAMAVDAVIRAYRPWTLKSAEARLAEAEERVQITRSRLPRVDEAARACNEARDIAYREHVDALYAVTRYQDQILDELRRLAAESEAALEDEMDNPSHGLGDGEAPAYVVSPADCDEAVAIATACDAAELYGVVVARRAAMHRAREAATEATDAYIAAVDAYRQVAEDAPEYRVDGPPLGRMTYSDLLWLFGSVVGALKLAPEAAAFLYASRGEAQFEARAAGLVVCRADVAEAYAHGNL